MSKSNSTTNASANNPSSRREGGTERKKRSIIAKRTKEQRNGRSGRGKRAAKVRQMKGDNNRIFMWLAQRISTKKAPRTVSVQGAFA